MDAGPDQSPFAGDIVTLVSSFTDLGLGDTHEATIDWGDETPIEPATVTEEGGSGSVEGSHIYEAAGVFPVIVTVTDDDDGVATGSLEARVLVRVPKPGEIDISGFALSSDAPHSS